MGDTGPFSDAVGCAAMADAIVYAEGGSNGIRKTKRQSITPASGKIGQTVKPIAAVA